MKDIFISYVQENKNMVIDIASGLEEAGYSTWYYTRDSLIGRPHIEQTNEATANAQAVLLVISPNSIISPEVDLEVNWAHRKNKTIMPVHFNITWDDFEEQKGTWSAILGGAVSIEIKPGSVKEITSRLVEGLKAMNISARSSGQTANLSNTDGPYTDALIEVLEDGIITEDERKKLDFLAKMLHIDHKETDRLETEVHQRLKNEKKINLEKFSTAMYEKLKQGDVKPEEKQYLDSLANDLKITEEEKNVCLKATRNRLESEKKQSLEKYYNAKLELYKTLKSSNLKPDQQQYLENLAKDLNISDEERETARQKIIKQINAPGHDTKKQPRKKIVSCWDEPFSEQIILTAIFGSPALCFIATADSKISVYDLEHNLVYRHQIQGQPLRISSQKNNVAITTWGGYVYYFGAQGLLWQAKLSDPVSAVAFGADKVGLITGTWSGRIAAFDTEGGELWQTSLNDGIATVAVSESNYKMVAGDYAGHLCVIDFKGEKRWEHDLRSGIIRVSFIKNSNDIITAMRNGTVAKLDINKQQAVWEYSTGAKTLDFSLSANEKRLLLADKKGHVHVFGVNGSLNIHRKYDIKDLTHALTSPISEDGHIGLCLSSSKGLFLVNNRQQTLTPEIMEPASSLAISPDGNYILLGQEKSAELFRFARVQIVANLEPEESLRKDQFSQLKITFHNTGELTAKDIKIKLEGPFECKLMELPSILQADNKTSSKKHLIKPHSDGAFPIRIKYEYIDEMGIAHQSEDMKILNSGKMV